MAKLAWGPEREVFSMAKPAHYVTFNSITDNNAIGDERNFLRIRKKNEGKFLDKLEMKKGDICTVQIFYHNNAVSRLNWEGQGFAYDTRISIGFVPPENGVIGAQAVLTSSNANPNKIWDFCTIEMLEDFKLVYVKDSAILFNSSGKYSIAANDIFSKDGALIGISRMDGIIPGCSEYSGRVEIDFKAV